MHDDVILLLEHQPQVSSTCRHALGALGYTRVLYRDYRRSGSVVPIGQTVDAVVAAWTDRTIARDAFLAAVEGATDLPHARGALVVSPFSTPGECSKAARLRGQGMGPVSVLDDAIRQPLALPARGRPPEPDRAGAVGPPARTRLSGGDAGLSTGPATGQR